MQSAGCRVVAQAKLLAEVGIMNSDSSFNPDRYIEWASTTSPAYFSDSRGFQKYIAEQGQQGTAPVGYAKKNGINLKYAGEYYFSSLSNISTQIEEIMSYINQGYYIIVGKPAHHAYIGRSDSLKAGEPILYNSQSDYSYLDSFIMTYADYARKKGCFNYYRLYYLDGTIESKNNIQVSTNTATNITTNSAQLNGRFTSTRKVHITEHGVYMGTDPNNMSLVARDTVNYNRSSLTMFYRTSKYYGDLLPGTTYYYKQYVIADDKTYWGEVRSFTTDGKVSCSISGEAYNISDKSASLRITTSLSSPGDIIISALRFGTSPDALHTLEQININQHTDQHVLERDLSEYNLTIEPNKTYYFAASVVVNGRVNVSDIFRFTTSAVIPEDTSEGGPDEEIIPPPEAPIITLSSNTIYVGQTATVQWNSVPNSNHYSLIVSGPVSVISEMNGNETWSELSDLTEGTYSINVWASGVGGSSPKSNTLTLTVLPAVITHHVFTKPATNITATSAQFNGSFSSDAKPHMTEHGVYMGTDPVTMEKVAVDKVDYYKSSLTMFYSTSKYYGTLMPDTTYYYCEYAVVDGVELRGETLSFKTSPPSGNMRYGVVHVNSGALAINDAPRASNNGSNPSKQIGRIPNGQTCIVDLSRTSGNWYWVTYNGVSGYAYKSYISLQ